MQDQPILPSFKNEGIKFDQEKPRMDLLSSVALEEIAKVLTFGAKKYGDQNWRHGIAWSRVVGALLRHTFSWMKGENTDPETGLSHLAHAGCCVMFLLEYEQTRREFDDRYIQAPKITIANAGSSTCPTPDAIGFSSRTCINPSLYPDHSDSR